MMGLVRRRLSAFAALLLGVALAGVVPAAAAPTAEGGTASETQVAALSEYWQADAKAAKVPSDTKGPVLRSTVLAKASPDECFAGIGAPYPVGSVDKKGNLICPEGSQAKVNQAYVWGLTKAGDDLWFGTGPNIHCLVLSSYLATTSSVQTDSYVCEGENSSYLTAWTPGVTLPAALGDFRPPDLFVYDQATRTLTEKNASLDAAGAQRLHATVGIRSAGSIGDRVFLAGPAIMGGLNVFVFSTDGTYVGSENLPDFSNIRKWVNVQDHLYTGVATSTGGQVLRYTGSDASDPFQYETVGTLTTEPAELAEHDGRLFASTWPNVQIGPAGQASLWMSPLIGDDSVLDVGSVWEQVWRAGDYEPDPVTAMTYGGGALVSFGGQLYWGTMHVPFTAALAHMQVYGPGADTVATIANVLGSHRAIAIFRGDDFATSGEYVELLYGAATLPVYTGTEWTQLPNTMGGVEPTYGAAGFGNTFNNYTWTMGVFGGQLYVGTMDWSYLLADGLPMLVEQLGLPPGTELPLPVPESGYGADLWRFPSFTGAAVAERIDGVGNYANYGIRTMVSDDALYLGSANPMNLMTDRTDDRPEGGWELLRLTPKK